MDGASTSPSPDAPQHLSPPERPGDLFGFARLAASASHWSAYAPTAEEVAGGMWSDLTAWCGDESHHDDMTLLVLRVA
jgi:serine phosphatase RsbU (regulator of sigma subunit)